MFASKKFVEDRIAAVLTSMLASLDADVDRLSARITGLHGVDKRLHDNLLLVTEILLKQRLHNADVMEHVAEMQAIVDDLQQQVDALTPKPAKAPVKPAVKKATPAPTKKV